MEQDDTEYSYELKIPKDRVAVLIGKSGNIKKEVEDATKSKIDIDSKEGDVIVSGMDSVGIFSAREVIKAIARGFNPETALLLLFCQGVATRDDHKTGGYHQRQE